MLKHPLSFLIHSNVGWCNPVTKSRGYTFILTVEASCVALRAHVETLLLVIDVFIQMLGGVILQNQEGTLKLTLFAMSGS